MQSTSIEARWREGEAVPGVAFGPGAHVRIMEGPFLDECASVRDLVFLADGPHYRVEVDAAHIELEFPQSALAPP